MDYDGVQVSQHLREKLKEFPLYEEGHWIGVHVSNHVYIGYANTPKLVENKYHTRFDIQVEPDVCYILRFNIDGSKLRQGHGSSLAGIIEDFVSEEFSCKGIVITPSGMSKEHHFWEKRGFRYFNSSEVGKTLT